MLKDNATLPLNSITTKRTRRLWKEIIYHKYFYIMLIPGIVFYLIFVYWPYFELRQSMWNWGVLGPKEFIGFSNFAKLLVDNDFWTAFFNTLILSGIRIILEISAAIILALLINEVRIKLFNRGVQTI